MVDRVETIDNWSGSPIQTTASASGTLLICNPFDALIAPVSGAWPPPALVMQLGDAEPSRGFTDDIRQQVSAKLGHYCELQSINSEDAITWNLFGTLMHALDRERAAFLNWLCERLDLPWTNNTRCAIELWRRIPHPYYPRADGPELDAILDGNDCVVFVEAKWLSPEGTGRGPDGTRVGQMHLRQRFFEKWGQAIYPDRGKLVLGVLLAGTLAPEHGPDANSIAVRSITWRALAAYPSHPNGDEFARYLDWKLSHSPRAAKLAG